MTSLAIRVYERTCLSNWIRYLYATKRPNALFLWIPKTGGTSVYQSLSNYGCPKLKALHLVHRRFANKGLVTFGHLSYQELVREKFISRRFDQSSYKFCFARNPYERAVSLFFYMKKLQVIPAESTFLDFCRRLRDRGCEGIGLYNYRGLSQCNRQVDWLEGIDVNFIGRLETLQDDLNFVLQTLQLPATRVGRLNCSAREHPAHYYCRESQQIVAELYREDFERFGYPICDRLYMQR